MDIITDYLYSHQVNRYHAAYHNNLVKKSDADIICRKYHNATLLPVKKIHQENLFGSGGC